MVPIHTSIVDSEGTHRHMHTHSDRYIDSHVHMHPLWGGETSTFLENRVRTLRKIFFFHFSAIGTYYVALASSELAMCDQDGLRDPPASAY